MNTGAYDKDCTTWSPQGDILQIKYVLEAVTQGTAICGATSKKYAVLAAFKKRQQSEFSSYDDKLFKIDDHCGIAIAGLTADARVLADYMRSECLNHKYVFESPMLIGRLISQIGDKAQYKTLVAGKRPYGVGLLTAAYDATGSHIYQTLPSGEYYEYKAMAMGSRDQSAKTYLEKNFEHFPGCNAQQLIKHAVKAISVTTEQSTELTLDNLDVTIVGEDQPWKKLSRDELQPYLTEVLASEPQAMDTAA